MLLPQLLDGPATHVSFDHAAGACDQLINGAARF
jgi:hypothetical protein